MHCPSEIHLRGGKQILRYIKGTISFGVISEEAEVKITWFF
jgi:hypothetical protein